MVLGLNLLIALRFTLNVLVEEVVAEEVEAMLLLVRQEGKAVEGAQWFVVSMMPSLCQDH